MAETKEGRAAARTADGGRRRELTLKELQEESLRILLDIDDFCRRNGIRYTLNGGTLLGAVRHKGFIPWDDDIDISMPRADFERFFKTFDNGRYTCSAPCLGNSYLFYGHVFDKTRTIVEPWRPMASTDDVGVWVDVFPLDNVPDDMAEYDLKNAKIKQMYWRTHKKRYAMGNLSECDPRHPGCWVKLAWAKLTAPRESLLEMVAEADEYIKGLCPGGSHHMGVISCIVNTDKEHIPSSVYSEYMDMDFEGHKLMVAKGYETILRTYYGDYMQLPPVEKRLPCHSAHKFYWR